MRRWISACVTFMIVLAGLTGAASSAQAATSAAKPFDITYGATYARGTVTFSNRTATVKGVQRAVRADISGCRYVIMTAYPVGISQKTGLTCTGVDEYTKGLTVDVPGGPGYVEIRFYDVRQDSTKMVEMTTVFR
ncbi:hypothetical protein [Kribbella sp. DT2]|uniref:hypothetical protein n=1 Tax=Kribbella sp. DT2 TaxID=3393427 RepID=UPI003CFA3A1B